jgi:hypothetical protein
MERRFTNRSAFQARFVRSPVPKCEGPGGTHDFGGVRARSTRLFGVEDNVEDKEASSARDAIQPSTCGLRAVPSKCGLVL